MEPGHKWCHWISSSCHPPQSKGTPPRPPAETGGALWMNVVIVRVAIEMWQKIYFWSFWQLYLDKFCCHCLCFFPQDVNVTLVGWGETSGSKIEDPCVDPLTVISTCKAKWAVISYWSSSCLCYYNCFTGSVISIFLLKMNKSASAYWRSNNLTVQSGLDKICVLSVYFFHLRWRQHSRLYLFLFNCETD